MAGGASRAMGLRTISSVSAARRTSQNQLSASHLKHPRESELLRCRCCSARSKVPVPCIHVHVCSARPQSSNVCVVHVWCHACGCHMSMDVCVAEVVIQIWGLWFRLRSWIYRSWHPLVAKAHLPFPSHPIPTHCFFTRVTVTRECDWTRSFA